MKINKWLESSLFKEYIQDVANVTNIYFFTAPPVAVVDFPSTEGTSYWAANSLDSLVLLNISLPPTESWSVGSDTDDLDISLYWESTNSYLGAATGTANWFLMTNPDKKPILMGEVSNPAGTGDMKLSDNNIVAGQKYKIYRYQLDFNQV